MVRSDEFGSKIGKHIHSSLSSFPTTDLIMEEPKLTPDEELRMENELKALDLELTYGATNFISGDLPPEITKMFLENVANFEAAQADARMVPVREFAGIPEMPPYNEVAEDDLESHIQTLLEQLEAAGVVIDRPEHLRPRGYYRFLTEEFLNAEMTDYTAPGMIHGFSYSDYRHDGPEFIREHVEETLLELLNLNRDVEGEWISETCRDQSEAISKAEVMQRIHIFRSKYTEIKPIAFREQQVQRTEVGMYFFFLVAWEGTPIHGGEAEHHEGLGVSQIEYEDGEWMVQGIMMPGFEF